MSGGFQKTFFSRNVSKATIRIEQRDGRPVVVKDYSIRRGVFKLYGRLTLHNEMRAYRRLRGIAGIPECFGLRSPYVLELQYISARPLSSFKPGEVAEEVFDRLERLVASVHSRGVANTDIHRSNVLIDGSGEVYLVDFAHAMVARNPDQPGMVTRLCMELDRYACARMRARYVRQARPVPRGLFGVLYAVGTGCKKVMKRFRKAVYTVL